MNRTVLCVAAVLAACGPPPRPSSPRGGQLRNLSDARALELIKEVALEQQIPVAERWSVDVGAPAPLAVDLRLAGTSFGVEWVSPQDRAAYQDLLPTFPPTQLQVLPGARSDTTAQILLVDHRHYRYDADLERVQAGSRGATEAEASLRSYVRDFIEYVRGQGAIP